MYIQRYNKTSKHTYTNVYMYILRYVGTHVHT